MSSIFQLVLDCLTGSDREPASYANEKQAIFRHHDARTAESIADEIVETISSAEKGGKELQAKLRNIVGEYSWKEKVAEWVLFKLEQVLREAQKLSPALKEAYDKACEAAKSIEGFVQEHPVFCTVIALGVLVLIAPWAIEAIGFGVAGPMPSMFASASLTFVSFLTLLDTVASAWQVRYAGYVPKGSLFSFFQRLGMKYHY
jgi:ElaB/YqjD/DUF883 family membrane-anchored ribosome-binding protein